MRWAASLLFELGYVIAGAIVERLGQKTWEELVEQRIIQPMGLKTAGFSPQRHILAGNFGFVMMTNIPGPRAD
jgi:CubicO group peptidase (beta-lactamase class C family)